MRARGTTGSVAGAANYNSGLTAHSVFDGLPDLALPKPLVPVSGPYAKALLPIKRLRVHFHAGTTLTGRIGRSNWQPRSTAPSSLGADRARFSDGTCSEG